MILVGFIGMSAYGCRISMYRCNSMYFECDPCIWQLAASGYILPLLVSAASCISEELQLALQDQAVERLLCLGTSAHAVT
jgi:hypothetical protein